MCLLQNIILERFVYLKSSYLSTLFIMVTVGYPCACQKEEGVVGADTIV